MINPNITEGSATSAPILIINRGSNSKDLEIELARKNAEKSQKQKQSHLDKSHSEKLSQRGITHQKMQASFKTLHSNPDRKATIALSCVEVTDLPMMTRKCQDIVGSILDMNPAHGPIDVLLPVELMSAHGFPDIDSDKVPAILNSRLKTWARVLQIEENALCNLARDKTITVNRVDVTFVFKSWSGNYLPESLKNRISTLVGQIKKLFETHYKASQKTCPLLEQTDIELKTLLITALSDFLKEANTQYQPKDVTAELGPIANGILFHTLIVMAQRDKNALAIAELLSKGTGTNNKKATLAHEGTLILHALNESHDATLANEFAHGIAYWLEECCSKGVLSLLENPNALMIYIPVRDHISQTNPLKALAQKINDSRNLEACNSYETTTVRQEKHLEAQVAKQASKPPSLEDDREKHMANIGTVLGTAAGKGLLYGQDARSIDPALVESFLTNFQKGFENASRRESVLSRSTSSASSVRGSSPSSGSGSDGEDDRAIKRHSIGLSKK